MSGLLAGGAMSQEYLDALIHEHTAAIAALERRISTHEAILLTLRILVLAGKAVLHLVQYAVGHKDPRTTEHYQRREEQLADNAVAYIHL